MKISTAKESDGKIGNTRAQLKIMAKRLKGGKRSPDALRCIPIVMAGIRVVYESVHEGLST
ncbi:MAG: hypothetical protein PHR10_08195 [Sphaerochaetaceae bacterium]|nr:hypothetical protein [Sphaerochaetaceae bacterium]